VGPTETSKFLRRLAEFANLDKAVVEAVIEREEKRYYHYAQKALPWIYRCKALPKEFYLLGGSSTALSITKFLVNDLGLLPRAVYVTEEIPDDHRERVVGLFQDLEAKTDFQVHVGNDGGIFQATASAETVQGRPAIFGSVLDELYAKQNLLPFVAVSTPLGNNLVGDSHYFGYRGATRLFHDFYSAAAGSAVNI
jgi:nitrogenase molybdenum-iron protein beta chain